MKHPTASYPISNGHSSASISEYSLKRPFDFFFASVALMLSFPLGLIFALAIKIEDGGPILYRQKRWGKDKKPINVYKFRTMVVDANEKFGSIQAQENDARTALSPTSMPAPRRRGRKYHCQKPFSEMSWVGPR